MPSAVSHAIFQFAVLKQGKNLTEWVTNNPLALIDGLIIENLNISPPIKSWGCVQLPLNLCQVACASEEEEKAFIKAEIFN